MDDSGADVCLILFPVPPLHVPDVRPNMKVNAPGGGYHPPDEPQRNRRSFQELRRHII